MAVCNKDCFNCIYDDCILDGLGRAPKAADDKAELTKNQVRGRKYYAEHREEQKAKKYAYWIAHKEEINAKRRQKTIEKRKRAADKAQHNNPILQC